MFFQRTTEVATSQAMLCNYQQSSAAMIPIMASAAGGRWWTAGRPTVAGLATPEGKRGRREKEDGKHCGMTPFLYSKN